MLFKKKPRPEQNPATKAPAGANKGGSGADSVSVQPGSSRDRLVRRTFPGPRNAAAALRVAVDRAAHGELIAHAKSSLEAEVCGVLAGQICEDDEGPFVHVEAIIRGAAAAQGSTHVTFTQATWNGIHETLERDYPKLRMVGWYHTHPGFGVEFSEMDLFIQRNFFSGPTQIALVMDPLSGAVAIAANFSGGIDYLQRFWVDGREQPCQVPPGRSSAPTAATGAPLAREIDSGLAQSVSSLDARMNQVLQALDDTRASYHRFLIFVGMLLCVTAIAVVGYTIYSQLTSRIEPPKVNQIVPIPVVIDGKVVMLGVGITSWEIPPELNATLLQMELLKEAAAAKMAKEAAEKAAKQQGGTNNVSTNSTAPRSK
jgi:proteasome lid subunit RPN8/RPN11